MRAGIGLSEAPVLDRAMTGVPPAEEPAWGVETHKRTAPSTRVLDNTLRTEETKTYICIILPLSHKSGKLCLCDPLNVSDLIFVFLLNSWVFFEQKTLRFFFQLVLEPCGRPAEKNSVGPKLAVFRPFPRGKKVSEKK